MCVCVCFENWFNPTNHMETNKKRKNHLMNFKKMNLMLSETGRLLSVASLYCICSHFFPSPFHVFAWLGICFAQTCFGLLHSFSFSSIQSLLLDEPHKHTIAISTALGLRLFYARNDDFSEQTKLIWICVFHMLGLLFLAFTCETTSLLILHENPPIRIHNEEFFPASRLNCASSWIISLFPSFVFSFNTSWYASSVILFWLLYRVKFNDSIHFRLTPLSQFLSMLIIYAIQMRVSISQLIQHPFQPPAQPNFLEPYAEQHEAKESPHLAKTIGEQLQFHRDWEKNDCIICSHNFSHKKKDAVEWLCCRTSESSSGAIMCLSCLVAYLSTPPCYVSKCCHCQTPFKGGVLDDLMFDDENEQLSDDDEKEEEEEEEEVEEEVEGTGLEEEENMVGNASPSSSTSLL